MKNYLPVLLSTFLISLAIVACSTSNDAWEKFTKCSGNACVNEALAVRDAFLKDPKALLQQFNESAEKGDDHLIGWLYIMRDSVLFNPAYGSTEARFEMQQKLVAAAKPFENDPELNDVAGALLTEIESLAIMSELEKAPLMFTGTYEAKREGGSAVLKLLELNADSVRYELNVVGGAPAHNQGMAKGFAVAKDNTIEIQPDNGCRIQLTLGEDVIVVKTLEGDPAACGFGNGVIADGEYARNDDLDPFRAEGGDEVPANLQGRWQSAEDAKAILTITQDTYQEMYDDEEIISTLFAYHKKCPKNCNPVADGACIRVVGQDEVCFTVVKADGKTLELSMIGGAGKTLVYKKLK